MADHRGDRAQRLGSFRPVPARLLAAQRRQADRNAAPNSAWLISPPGKTQDFQSSSRDSRRARHCARFANGRAATPVESVEWVVEPPSSELDLALAGEQVVTR
ncbi:hypothetical protein [Lentzea sp. NPDC092896]|uniref:hypothetical protein n=1 Tax=Lentzea sp. NPDC092896 TaxID=3364127 RepID=UPI003823D867